MTRVNQGKEGCCQWHVHRARWDGNTGKNASAYETHWAIRAAGIMPSGRGEEAVDVIGICRWGYVTDGEDKREPCKKGGNLKKKFLRGPVPKRLGRGSHDCRIGNGNTESL